ncbi:MAG: 1-acyl-sn-glycerol-3-phosphate acyltransferase [Lachnospiraceae bacterium]|nr:1-acyl-sn-glycerol-3-phosphate acyltransferase [Lachnospiraceae bacterium]
MMLRFILGVLAVTLFHILTIPLMLVMGIIRIFNRNLAARWSQKIVNFGFYVETLCAGTKTVYLGDENLPKEEAVMFVANHRGFFDIILTSLHAPGPLGFIAKKEILWVPLLNIWMVLIGCVFIDRKNIRQSFKVLEKACEGIKNDGISNLVCPEGTRNRGEEGTLLKFHDAALKVALKKGVTLVPVAISNSAAVMEADFPGLHPATVVVEFCKPIRAEELSNEEKRAPGVLVAKIIEERLKQHKGMY